MKRLAPIHPGEILLEDFMKPVALSINQLARDLAVPPNRISAIVNGTRAITADTALRLSTYFNVSPETWLGLQLDYDLRLTRQRDGDKIIRAVRTAPPHNALEFRTHICVHSNMTSAELKRWLEQRG